jgi:hypothetical protein
MGVATGPLLRGQAISQSSVMDLAKAVSDMGCGGQVLVDERTFSEVKDRLRELGAEAAGIDGQKLTESGGSWWARLTCRWGTGALAGGARCAWWAGRGTGSGMPLNWTSPLSNRPWWY